MFRAPGGPRVSDATVEQLRESIDRSPRKSMRCESRETGISNVTVWRVLRCGECYETVYTYRCTNYPTDADNAVRKEFCTQMSHRIYDDDSFLDSVIISDSSRLHVSGKVSTQNCRICGSQNIRSPWNMPKGERVLRPQQRKSVRALLHGDDHYRQRVSGHAPTVPHPQSDEDDQQDGAPPHCLGEVRKYLSTHFPGRWIGRAAPIAWPSRSSDLTPLDLFLWRFV
jgi:hypothetical protein